ncbi:MAG: ATP-binding protein [Patescibacteria group bacterium]
MLIIHELVTDFFWAASIGAMALFSWWLTRVHLRPSAARWFSSLIVVASINIIGLVLTDLIHDNYRLGLRGISVGRALIPYCQLVFTLVFPYRRRLADSRIALYVLAIPALATIVVTDPLFAPNDVSYQLKYHIPWMGAYFVWSYLNLCLSYGRSRLRTTRRQHILLSLAIVPASAMHFTTSIVLPAVGRNGLWRYNWVPILAAFAFLLFSMARYGYLRRHAAIKRTLLAQSINTAGLGSQIVTHAVKNSLQVIRTLAETASADEYGDWKKNLARIMALCDDLAERMNRLNLLMNADFSTHPERLRIADVLERSLERAMPRLKGVRVVRDYSQDAPAVMADATHLEEVFFNLLVNAAEAMPQGGCLRLEVGTENDWVLVGFHDQGVGIPRDQMPRIFEPFKSSKTAGANWGIGLSFCHLIVERLGGDLYAESKEGKGSSFYVVLPISGP